jgi:hypothetical protein
MRTFFGWLTKTSTQIINLNKLQLSGALAKLFPSTSTYISSPKNLTTHHICSLTSYSASATEVLNYPPQKKR